MPTSSPAHRRLAAHVGAAVTALALLAGGCSDIVSQLEANQMAGALLLQTPGIEYPPNSGTMIPGATVFTLEFASVNLAAVNTQPSQAATPTDGAVVSLQYTDGTGKAQSIPVPGQGNNSGTYVVSSANSALTYIQGQVYTAVITYAGTTYQLQVTPPPPIGLTFENPSGTAGGTDTLPVVTNYQAGSALTIGRVPSTDTSVAFYEMSTVTNGSPVLVTTNAPQTVVSFLEFILPGGSTQFQASTFNIAGSFFQSATTYLVTLTSVAQGSQVTGNASLGSLFAGSTFLAGAAAGGIVQTK